MNLLSAEFTKIFYKGFTMIDIRDTAEMWLYCRKTSKALSRYATIIKVTPQGVK